MKKIIICLNLLLAMVSSSAQITYTWTGINSTAWNNNLNWNPIIGFPGATDNAVITSSGFSPLLDITRSVNNFTLNTGTLNLNTFTLGITGTALFNNGNLNNGTIAPSGTIATFNSTTFGANVSANCANILLNGCTFNGTATFTKSGSANSSGNGGNTFNGITIIAVNGAGILTLSNVTRDIFNNDVTFNSTSSIIYPAYNGTTATQFNGNVILNSTGTSGGIRFCQGAGSATLASSKSISIGAAGFSSGILYFRKFIQLGTTAQTLTNFTGATGLYLEAGNVFNGDVTFVAPGMLLDGTTFNGKATLEKNGSVYNYSQGGNIFNAPTSITNSGSNELLLAGTNRDIFNDDVTFTSSGSSKINIAYSDMTGTLFNGNIFVNSTGSSTGLNFSYGPGTCTLAPGKTISIGSGGFSAGTLYIRNFTQAGTASQTMTAFSGTTILQFAAGTTFNGNVTFAAPQLYSTATTFNGNATIEKTGASSNSWYGDNIFNGTTTITNSGSGILDLASTAGDNFNGDVTFIQTGSARLSPLVSGYSTFAGNISTLGSIAALSFGYTWSSGRMIINGTGVQNFNGSANFPPSVRTLSITTGSTLNLNVKLTAFGDIINNGSFSDSGPGITLAGTSSQQIGGSSLTTFKNLTLNNSTGSYLSANENISGALTISAGTFSTTGYNFTLLSDSNGTAHIAPISGDFAGNITMQRYIGGNSTGWRLLASPVSGVTINDWQDNFITSGFPGSTYPNFSFVSIYTYDETVGGIGDNGYSGASNATNPVIPGQGYWCYIGPVPLTVDVSGPPMKFGQTFSVSYTPSGGPSEDGWVMVGNPYPSPIDWRSAAWTKHNINDAIYIWNADLQQYSSWVSGTSINGGSNLVASSQSFWIQANGANPVLSCTENVKTGSPATFFRSLSTNSATPFNNLKLFIEGNGYKDETLLRFGSGATQGYNSALDARKLYSANPQAPGIATQDSTATDMSINSLPPVNALIHIPVKTLVGATGNYTIAVDSLSDVPSGWCIVLEDLVTGVKTNVGPAFSYTFFIEDTTHVARFVLHVSGAHRTAAVSARCNQYHDGKAIAVAEGIGPWNYQWFNNVNSNLQLTSNTFQADTLRNLAAGNYSVQISSVNGLCSTSVKTVTVSQPPPVHAGFIIIHDTINAGNADSLVIHNTSSWLLAYLWDFGDGSPSGSSGIPPAHHYTSPGIYTVRQIAGYQSCSDTATQKIIVMDPLGINENGYPDAIRFYPNPGKGIFYLDLNYSDVQDARLEIYTASGEMIYHTSLVADKTEINILPHAKGIYFYRVTSKNGGLYQGKLIYD